MKKLLILILLVLPSIAITAQEFEVPKELVATAREYNARKVKNLTIFIDQTSYKTKEDLKDIIERVNTVYTQVNIFFKTDLILKIPGNFNTAGDLLTSVKRCPSQNDITIYITGSHTGDVIGVEHNNVIIMDLKGSNINCVGLVSHELGHTFGLLHGSDPDYIMSIDGNTDYCEKFTRENLSILQRL